MFETSHGDKTRTFLAILLPEAFKETIFRVSSSFRQLPLDVKWVEKKNYHLTLKFFGSLTIGEIQRVDDTLKRLTLQVERFSLSCGGFGVFPDLKHPRVVWLGLHGDVESLHRLRSMIEEKLFLAGFPKEDKRFMPHLTLGRFRSQANADMFLKLMADNPPSIPVGDIEVTAVHLMGSRLTSRGPHYTPLAVYPLR